MSPGLRLLIEHIYAMHRRGERKEEILVIPSLWKKASEVNQVIQHPSRFKAKITPVISPQKKVRLPARQVKREKKVSPTNGSSKRRRTQNDGEIEDGLIGQEHDGFSSGEDVLMQGMDDLATSHTSLEEELASYFDAVQSGCVGFVPLHRKLFVVEGWNKFKEQGTVSLKIKKLNPRWLTYHYRINGSTLKQQMSLGPRKPWYANVHWGSLNVSTNDFTNCMAKHPSKERLHRKVRQLHLSIQSLT